MRTHVLTARSGRTVLLLLALLVALFAGVAAILIHLRTGQRQELQRSPTEDLPADHPNVGLEELSEVELPSTAEAEEEQVPDRVALVDPSSAEEDAPVLGFSGQVIGHRSGEPLPELFVRGFALDAEDKKAHVALTDGDGRFVLEDLAEATRVRLFLEPEIEPRNRSSDARMIFFDPEGPVSEENSLGTEGSGRPGPFVFAMACGPTCFFDVDWPTGYGPEDFTVLMTKTPPRQERAWVSNPLQGDLLEPTEAHALHPDLYWARFPRLEWENSAWVELRSRDRRFRGGVRIRQTFGVVTKPLRIQLHPANSLTVTFDMVSIDTDLDYEQDWCELRLEQELPATALKRTRPIVIGQTAEHALPCRFEFLEPGEYVLSTHDKAWELWSMRVTVAPGENDIGRFELVPRPVVGDVRGRIVSASGAYDGGCHVSLHDHAFEHDAHYDHSLNWEEDENGRLSAPIEFERVRAGNWKLFVHCHDGFEWPHSLQVIEAPLEDILIELPDRRMDLSVDLVDANTGELLPNSFFRYEIGDERRRPDGPQIRLRDLPDRRDRLRYYAEADGYRPVRGTGADFTVEMQQGELRTQLQGVVPMERGWGALVQAFDRDTGGLIHGVEIFMDGVSAGKTDEDGELQVRLDSAPKNLRVEREGWKWVGSVTISMADGTIYAQRGELRLPMERAE